MLKLPRNSLSPAEIAVVESFFESKLQPICGGSETVISSLALDSRISQIFQSVFRTGCFSRGLETIAKLLDDEKKGLSGVEIRTNQKSANRMSRLLFISNDGSERFYRQVASLLKDHGNRVWCCQLEANSEDFGNLLGVASAKAVMINDKKALALFLTALVRHD